MKRIISFLLRKVPRKYLQLFSHSVLKVVAILYLGRGVICPVCSSSYRKFLPYGRVARPNALCPKCLSLERHRLLWLYLKNKTNFFTATLKMLHVAPEHCFISRFEGLKNLEYITADLESPLAKVKMDIHEIPFEDNTFDVIFCNHVLEHVEDDIRAMQEMFRVLKPGGWAILQIPLFHPLSQKTISDPSITDPVQREEMFGQDDHVRKYGLDFGDRIRTAGFHLHEDQYVMELSPEQVQKHALPANEPIFRAEKVSV